MNTACLLSFVFLYIRNSIYFDEESDGVSFYCYEFDKQRTGKQTETGGWYCCRPDEMGLPVPLS